MSRVEPNRNIYVGHRYVPKIFGEWNKQNDYEGLSIVTYQGTSYTSKKRVPVGIDILNKEFWVVTGNYNAQVDYYRQETERVADDLLLKSDQIYVDTELGKKSDKTYVDTELGKKSDQTYVDTELGKKSDKTYVDTELGKKSDQTYVDTELGKKSDKTYVDTELGKKSDQTYVDTELGKKVNKGEMVLNIKDFGAIGDGETDDTVSLKNSIESLNVKGGGMLLVPDGTFKITDTLNLPSNITIKGTGRETSILKTVKMNKPLFKKERTQSVYIENISLIGAFEEWGSNTGYEKNHGIELIRAGRGFIRDCYIFGFGGHGIYGYDYTNTYEFSGCKIWRNGLSGIEMAGYFENGSNSSITALNILNNSIRVNSVGINLSRVTQSRIQGNVIESNFRADYDHSPDEVIKNYSVGFKTSDFCQSLLFSGNYIENNDINIDLTFCTNSTFDTNYSDGNYITDGEGYKHGGGIYNYQVKLRRNSRDNVFTKNNFPPLNDNEFSVFNDSPGTYRNDYIRNMRTQITFHNNEIKRTCFVYTSLDNGTFNFDENGDPITLAGITGINYKSGYPANNKFTSSSDINNHNSGLGNINFSVGKALAKDDTFSVGKDDVYAKQIVITGEYGGREGVTIRKGNYIPNGFTKGEIGDVFINTSGTTGTVLYIKETDAGENTGWVGK